MKNPGVTLNSAFLRPRSRGTVRIASADPNAAPLIDPNYWADPYDRECSIKGPQASARDSASAGAEAVRDGGTDARRQSRARMQELAEYAYRSCKTDHHPAGTCAMGSGADAVVTPDLQVCVGLLGIRIVDASVMPFVPSSNTNAPTIMVAEKASDMILGKSSARGRGLFQLTYRAPQKPRMYRGCCLSRTAAEEPRNQRGSSMNPFYDPVRAALAGSVIGGLTCFAAAWRNQERQDRTTRVPARQGAAGEVVQAVHRRREVNEPPSRARNSSRPIVQSTGAAPTGPSVPIRRRQ